MSGNIGSVWSKYFTKSPIKTAPPITIKDDLPPVNLANDRCKDARVQCWCHASKLRWGSYTLESGQKKAAVIIPLEFEVVEKAGAKLKEFELAITFGVTSETQPEVLSTTAANMSSSSPSVYLVPGTRPWPRCVTDLVKLSKREWDLLLSPELTIMDQGVKLGQAGLPPGWTKGKVWTFESYSEAVDIFQRGTYWKYKVFDFDEVGANKCDWKGAVAVIHDGMPFNAVGHLQLKAYKKPLHLRNKTPIAQEFIFEPRAQDGNVDLTANVNILAKEIEEAYQEMQDRKFYMLSYMSTTLCSDSRLSQVSIKQK